MLLKYDWAPNSLNNAPYISFHPKICDLKPVLSEITEIFSVGGFKVFFLHQDHSCKRSKYWSNPFKCLFYQYSNYVGSVYGVFYINNLF